MALEAPVTADPLRAAAAGAAVAVGAGVPLAVTPPAEAEGLPNTPPAGPVHAHAPAPRFPGTHRGCELKKKASLLKQILQFSRTM